MSEEKIEVVATEEKVAAAPKRFKKTSRKKVCSFCAEKHYFKRMSVVFRPFTFWIKKKKALIHKAFLMVAAIGFEPMTLRV